MDPAQTPAAPYLRVDQGGGYAIASTRLTAAPARLVPGQATARPLWIGGERVALVLVQAQWGASAFTVHIPAGADLGSCLYVEHVPLNAFHARRFLHVVSPGRGVSYILCTPLPACYMPTGGDEVLVI